MFTSKNVELIHANLKAGSQDQDGLPSLLFKSAKLEISDTIADLFNVSIIVLSHLIGKMTISHLFQMLTTQIALTSDRYNSRHVFVKLSNVRKQNT